MLFHMKEQVLMKRSFNQDCIFKLNSQKRLFLHYLSLLE